MTSAKDVPGLSPISLRKDLIHFQDETLKDIREMQSKLDLRYAKSDELLNEKITKYDQKIKAFEKKITELSNLITTDNLIREKVESLLQFKEETQDTIFKRRAKFNELEKRVYANIDNINQILTDTVLYPAMIGKTAKFQTFHDFIDYVVQEISHLNTFKNKSQMDSMTAFKKKIDGALDAFKIQISNLTPKELTTQMLSELEEKFESTLRLYDDRLQDTRVENANYSVGIQKKSEEMLKQMSTLLNEQNSINKKIEKIQKFEGYNILSTEISEINIKINKIFDILRDLASYHPEVKRDYASIFIQKPQKKIISRVKEYIKGNINAEELATMRPYVLEKKEDRVLDNFYPNLKINQNNSPNNLLINMNENSPTGKRHSVVFASRNNNFEEENINNVNKKPIKKKQSYNLSKQDNIIAKLKFLEREKSKFANKNADNFESSKMDNYIPLVNNNNINNNDLFNKQKEEKVNKNIIIEEVKEINNSKISIKNTNKINKSNNLTENDSISSEKSEIEIINERNKNDFNNINDNDNEIQNKKDNNISKISKTENIIEINNNSINNNNKKEEKIKKEVSKNNSNINLKEKETINNNIIDNNKINKDINNISKNEIEKKNEIIPNLKQYNNNYNYNYYKNNKDSKRKDNLVNTLKDSIIIESEYKNNKTRNIDNLNNINKKKVSFSKEEVNNKKSLFQSSKKDFILSNITLHFNDKSKESFGSSLKESKNKKMETENNKVLIPIKYDSRYQYQNTNIISIKKKLYNTYANFPKISQDYNSISSSKDDFTNTNIYNRTINEEKYNKKGMNNIPSVKQQKKLLLLNPDDLPLNYFDKTYKDIFKNELKYNPNQSKKINNINGKRF